MNELIPAIGAVKNAIDILVGAVRTGVKAKIEQAISDVTSKLLATQQAAMEALKDNLLFVDRLREADKTIANLQRECEQRKAHAQKLERYELFAVKHGVLVPRLKEAYAKSERAHYICPRCIQLGDTRLLQSTMSYSNLECVECKTVFPTEFKFQDAAKTYIQETAKEA